MALIKIIDWKQIDSIGVDSSNPESKVDRDGTIINPIPVSEILVELLVDGVSNSVSITPPYSRAKVVAKIHSELLDKRKTDEGAEFEVTP